MVGGVVALRPQAPGVARAHDAPGTPVRAAGCGHGVLVVAAARPPGQHPFAVLVHHSVAAVGKRPAAEDQPVGLLRLHRQRAQRREGQAAGRIAAGERGGCAAGLNCTRSSSGRLGGAGNVASRLARRVAGAQGQR